MLRRSAVRASCRSPDSTSPTRTTCCGQVASILVATSSHTPDFLVTYVIATSSRGCYAETVPVDISFIQYIRSSIDRTAGFLCSAFTIYKLYNYLACSANLPGWLYILPIFLFFFIFNGRHSNGPIFIKISGLVHWWNDLSTSYRPITLRSLKGNQIKVANSVFFCRPIFIVTLPFQNRLQYHNSNFKRLHA